MVTRVLSLAFLIFSMLVPVAASATEKLTVEPDRTQLYEGEVLTLTVKGSMKIDINLSNLFSFDLSQLPSPDIEKVEPDFEILARNQRYSVQTVNNEMVGEITWTYQLAPTRTGALSIPALTFKEAVSDPVSIEVISGTPPDQSPATRDSYIELSADKAEVYVQEQLVLTIQLFFSGNLIRGELSEPQHPDAIIESLGQQREFTRYRDGIRYRVVERKYAIFPQTPGTLTLAPIRFEGQARDAAGKLRFLRDQQQLYDVPVKPVPQAYPENQPWLPASNLAVLDEGLPSGEPVSVGSNLSRTLTLQAEGLPAEALPPIRQQVPEAIRSYPEQPVRNTETTADGLNARLQQVTALVPVKSGDVILPSVRVPWWNTDTDQLEEAVLPERRIRIAGSGQTIPPQAPTTEKPEKAPSQEPARAPGPDTSQGIWVWSTMALAVLWLATLALWWQTRRRTTPPGDTEADSATANERQAFQALLSAIDQKAGQTSAYLLRWARLRFPKQTFHQVSDLVKLTNDQHLGAAFEHFQASLYSGQPTSGTDEAREQLKQALHKLRKHNPEHPTQSGSDLAPLYPADLTGR
ncbi:BatD family protein [Marinobacter sp. VGCF2001]|uniref:BatD family protein n=1 Tax=Marinobacter sp. VGCF2001 TaxID=3417189 RepID=UPI003CF03172